jgi:beta-lactamase superfamily II metal-dependent hydrolase
LDVYFIDVGQGDAILLDHGTAEVLIDGGTGSVNVANFIKPYVDGPIEVVIATHMDADHIGGLTAVLNTFKVLSVWDNGAPSTSATYKTFKTAIQSNGAIEHTGRRGDTIIADSLSFKVLNPVNTTGTSNNNSIVLRLDYSKVSFQFEGDTEQEAETSMLAAGLISHVDILKVGHHGSRTASSLAFLTVAKPDVAIYSCGIGNTYRHPHQETLVTLDSTGAKIYGTDIHGTVVINTDGKVYDVQPEKQVPPVKPSIVSSTPTSTPTPTPTPPLTPTPIPPTTPTTELTLVILSVTSPVGPGYSATLVAKTAPGATCGITVYYKSGSSTAQGLYSKTADANGSVSWTWKVGTRTTPGSWRIVVTASLSGKTVSQTTYFTVQ